MKLTPYLTLTQAVLKVHFHYRQAFFWGIASSLLGVAAKLFLWQAVFSSAAEANNQTGGILGGFSLEQVIHYTLLATLVGQILKTQVEFEMSDEIRSGEIAIALIRPIHYLWSKFWLSVGQILPPIVFSVLPLLVVLVFFFGVALPKPWILAGFLLSLSFSFFIYFLLSFIVGIFSFRLTHIWGVSFTKSIVISFFSGSLMPLSFMGSFIEKTSHFLPFKSMVSIPVFIFMGRLSDIQVLSSLGEQIFWSTGLLIACEILWHKSIPKLEILGG